MRNSHPVSGSDANRHYRPWQIQMFLGPKPLKVRRHFHGKKAYHQSFGAEDSFQAWIWPVWTSYRAASWATVSSPLTASRATLALNVGLCFLRSFDMSPSSSRQQPLSVILGAELSLSHLSEFPGPPQTAHQSPDELSFSKADLVVKRIRINRPRIDVHCLSRYWLVVTGSAMVNP